MITTWGKYQMPTNEIAEVMTDEGRALLTDREREILSGDAGVSDNYRYKVQSVVRTRVRKRFEDDVAFLEAHFPEVYDMIESAVCNGEE